MVLLQVALDLIDIKRAIEIAKICVNEGFDVVEAGTPLIKRFGVEVLRVLREKASPSYLLADTKTVDAAEVEVRLVKDFGGDYATVMGIAPRETVEAFIRACREAGVGAVIDLMNIEDPLAYLQRLTTTPKMICLHVGIDIQRRRGVTAEDLAAEVGEIRRYLPSGVLVAVAGGLTPRTAPKLLEAGADVIIVGGAITKSKDPRSVARELVEVCKDV